MQKALQQFQTNLVSVRHLDTIYLALSSQTTAAVDLSEILRSEIVAVVSALDHFIHDLVRIGMLEIFRGMRPTCNAYLSYSISLECLQYIVSTNNSMQQAIFFEQEIKKRNAYHSFQEASKISQALSKIGIKQIWQQVATEMNQTQKDVKDRLNLIIDRRNQIAHEFDMQAALGVANIRNPIDRILVNDAVDFIEEVANAIYKVVINTV